MHCDAVHAVADLGGRLGNVLGHQTPVDWLPGLAAVVGSKRTRSRDGDIDPARLARIEQDRVQAHAARARLPLGAGAVAAQPGQLLPASPAVLRAEQRRVLDARIDHVGIRERWLQMPDPLELPRVRRAVVKLVSGERLAGLRGRVVDELVALALGHALGRLRYPATRRLPGFATVAGALDDLPEPTGRLRGIDTVRVNRRSLHVIDFPARKKRAGDLPLLALPVRRQQEGALARANQDPYLAHGSVLPCLSLPFFDGRFFGRPPPAKGYSPRLANCK